MWLLAVLVFVASESEKIRPYVRPKLEAQAPRIKLAAAGGDCAGAQIVVQGPALALAASASEGVDLYRVATIDLKFPSGPDGATGDWPDALIPARDVL
jgi:hypothetical protein